MKYGIGKEFTITKKYKEIPKGATVTICELLQKEGLEDSYLLEYIDEEQEFALETATEKELESIVA